MKKRNVLIIDGVSYHAHRLVLLEKGSVDFVFAATGLLQSEFEQVRKKIESMIVQFEKKRDE